MPRPLGPEPDTGPPIHEQVRTLVAKAHRERMAAVGLTFSRNGHAKALMSTVPGMDPWGGGETYLGLPFTIGDLPSWEGDVKLKLVPGNSDEAKAHRAAQRATPAPTAAKVGKRMAQARPTIETLAEGLSRPELLHVINAWCVANASDVLVPALRNLLATQETKHDD